MDITYAPRFYLDWNCFANEKGTSHHVHTLTLNGQLFLAPLKDDVQVS